MKLYRRIFTIIMSVIMLANFCIFQAFAHQVTLEVSYDNCIVDDNNDGIDERWYRLNISSHGWHYGEDKSTITYRFEEIPDNSPVWSTGVTEAIIETIKTAYANSMKKWNNVYFYSYNSDGTITKNKIINIVEASSDEECNISISFVTNTNNAATTSLVYEDNYDFSEEGVDNHKHYSDFYMTVNVDCFYFNEKYTRMEVLAIKEKTGAHEMGHVLGLIDIDINGYCEPSDIITDPRSNHHEEILMGYGEEIGNRATDITYKDIAGVAITRGFHTDDNHMWLNAGVQSDGTYKLICSICNGVKYVNSLSGYTYYTYGYCNEVHEISSGNMMAVASYGDKDYYKCKYCRYVAPFSNIVSQNYSAVAVTGGTHHRATNNVPGLNYTFLEEHEWINSECVDCVFSCTHTIGFTYTEKNGMTHIRTCVCGQNTTEPHFIRSSDVNGKFANCLGCGRLLNLDFDNAIVQPFNIAKASINGSYILANGIVVLVDEDIEAYMNGSLQFYDVDDVPTIE